MIVMDERRALVEIDGREVRLSKTEWLILRVLAVAGDDVVPVLALSQAMGWTPSWGVHSPDHARLIVMRLRRKLRPDAIQNVRGFGYCAPEVTLR